MLNVNFTDEFHYVVECDIEGGYPGCAGCNPGIDDGYDMCRCFTIHGVTFDSNSFWTAISLVKNYSDSSPERKALEVMALKNLTSQELGFMFKASWGPGYYGEELESIRPTSAFMDHVCYLNNSSDIELLHYAFMKEYGKLTSPVKKATKISLASIPVKNVQTPPGYDKSAKINTNSFPCTRNKYNGLYHEPQLSKVKDLFPIVCTPVGSENYKLIDGCHRFMEIQGNRKPVRRKINALVIS